MDSVTQPFTPDQWNALNHEADVIYADFLNKVSAGRKLPLAQVQDIARGRVWTGADAASRGLVNQLGGFWTAAGLAAQLGHVDPTSMVFRVYPKPKGFLNTLENLFGGNDASVRAISNLQTLTSLPEMQDVVAAAHAMPRQDIELRAPNLPQMVGSPSLGN
jgi:protease-4